MGITKTLSFYDETNKHLIEIYDTALQMKTPFWTKAEPKKTSQARPDLLLEYKIQNIPFYIPQKYI